MKAALQAWRDTLSDLGVMGLVPPPAPPPLEAPPRPAQTEAPRRVDPPPPPGGAPEGAWVCPSDPVGAPPESVVREAPNLAALEAALKGCLACPLGAGRLNFVFGEGSPQAQLMFIGEGPGREEDLQGRPFVGRAGELLDKMIGAIGLARTDVYIANVVKCRPPDNRVPTPREAARCLGYLRRQIELVRPAVIVTLGATPLRELLGIHTGITRVRGQWQTLDFLGGIPVMPTFHPAYVLRQYTQDVRRAVWQDLLAAKGRLRTDGPPLTD